MITWQNKEVKLDTFQHDFKHRNNWFNGRKQYIEISRVSQEQHNDRQRKSMRWIIAWQYYKQNQYIGNKPEIKLPLTRENLLRYVAVYPRVNYLDMPHVEPFRQLESIYSPSYPSQPNSVIMVEGSMKVLTGRYASDYSMDSSDIDNNDYPHQRHRVAKSNKNIRPSDSDDDTTQTMKVMYKSTKKCK